MRSVAHRLLGWRSSEAFDKAEEVMAKSCVLVLAAAAALCSSALVSMVWPAARTAADVAGRIATVMMLMGFAGLGVGACLRPPRPQHGMVGPAQEPAVIAAGVVSPKL